MQVILLDNVKDIGKKGQSVKVSDGLARNKLIPLKKAAEATPGNIAKYKDLIKNTQPDAPQGIPPKVLEVLETSPLIIPARCDNQGSLYKAINEREVLRAIHANIPAHLRQFVLQNHITIPVIKKTGKYTIKLGEHGCAIEIISEK